MEKSRRETYTAAIDESGQNPTEKLHGHRFVNVREWRLVTEPLPDPAKLSAHTPTHGPTNTLQTDPLCEAHKFIPPNSLQQIFR